MPSWPTAEHLGLCRLCGALAAQAAPFLALQFSQHISVPARRSVLAGYIPGGAHPSSLLFERNPHGKPRLLWPSAARSDHVLSFSLTHTATLIGLAVTGAAWLPQCCLILPGVESLGFMLATSPTSHSTCLPAVDGLVGLDVEGSARRTRRDPLRLARRRFSETEIADLLGGCMVHRDYAISGICLWCCAGLGMSLPACLPPLGYELLTLSCFTHCCTACPDDDSRAARFLQLWTLKEAYVKALGRGISAPPGLRSFSFRLSGFPQYRQQQQQQQQWQSPNAPGGTGSCLPPVQSSTRHSTADGSSSDSSDGSGSRIEFHTLAPDMRHWEFALLQPAPDHMAAVCVQRHPSNTRGSRMRGEHEPLQPLCLLHFDATAVLEGGDGSLLEPQILAQGSFPC